MDPTVIRTNDFFARRAELRRTRKIVAWIAIVHALILPIALVWQGGLLGLGVVLLLMLIVAPWVWIEDALSRRHMRRRLQAARALDGNGVDGGAPRIDAWLLVSGSLGLGFHVSSQSLYLFTDKGRTERFDVRELRRMQARHRRNWLGRSQDVLFISDALAGPGLELPVTEGDLHSFLRLVSRDALGQGREPATLAART